MPLDIKESDWKILRRVHALALERFSARVLAEVERIVEDGARTHHERYLDIYKLMEQRDRQMSLLFDDPRRSQALAMLARIRSEGLLTEDEFSSLSAETRGAIERLVGAE
jgi:hypothetical protein